jgi:hypothetical protein
MYGSGTDVDLDLAKAPLRELNAALHTLANGHQRAALAGQQSARQARHRRAASMRRSRSRSAACRLLLRRHEQAGEIMIARQCRSWRRREHDVGRNPHHGDASQAAGATGNGGFLVIDGNASARCGISMKGIDIVVEAARSAI